MRGRFVTFEGGEGSGKSTQIGVLAARLQTHGISCVTTREPGGSPGAEALRHVILSGAAQPLGPLAEALLFSAARDDHLRQTIAPALAAGQWVLCDRFSDSTRVYQGDAGGVDQCLLRALERIVVGDARPDLTLVLDLPAEIGLARADRRRGSHDGDRFEAQALQFHERLRSAYRALAAAEPDRCRLIDAQPDRERVAEAIWSATADAFALASDADPRGRVPA